MNYKPPFAGENLATDIERIKGLKNIKSVRIIRRKKNGDVTVTFNCETVPGITKEISFAPWKCISDNVPGTDDLKYEDLIPDESAEQDYQKVLDCISNMTLRKRILFFLDSICSEKEKEVLICHYGVGCEPKSLTTLADSFGVSTERIRQIKNKAILKLRNSPLKNTMFSEFEFQSDTSKRKELLLQQINTKEKKQKSYEDAIKALENL